ncbi:MAG: S8 family serine peptidase [Gemmataceae bacterium]
MTSPGETKPDVVGYGVDLTLASGRDYSGRSFYETVSGTSFAAPYVSRIAALYRSHNPNLTVSELREVLREQALEVSTPARAGAGLVRWTSPKDWIDVVASRLKPDAGQKSPSS